MCLCSSDDQVSSQAGLFVYLFVCLLVFTLFVLLCLFFCLCTNFQNGLFWVKFNLHERCVCVARMNYCHLTLVCLRFATFEINLKPRNFPTLPWAASQFESWWMHLRILHNFVQTHDKCSWNFEILKFWNFEILSVFHNFASSWQVQLKFWNSEILRVFHNFASSWQVQLCISISHFLLCTLVKLSDMSDESIQLRNS